MREENYWFIISPKNYEDLLNKAYLPIDSDFFLIEQNLETKQNEDLIIYEAYHPGKSLPLKINPWGLWDAQNGLTVRDKDKWIRRSNLTSVTFRCASESVSTSNLSKYI